MSINSSNENSCSQMNDAYFLDEIEDTERKNQRIHMRTTSALFHVITLNIVNVEIDIFYRETDITTILHAITSLAFRICILQ